MLVMGFVMGAVNPIENVQGAVGSHEKDVIAGKVLHFTVTLQNNQLGQNTNRFQVNGKCPQQFNDGKAIVLGGYANDVGDKGQNGTRSDTELVMQKGILSLVIGRLDGFLKANRVNDGSRTDNVQDLHDRIVKGIKGRK